MEPNLAFNSPLSWEYILYCSRELIYKATVVEIIDHQMLFGPNNLPIFTIPIQMYKTSMRTFYVCYPGSLFWPKNPAQVRTSLKYWSGSTQIQLGLDFPWAGLDPQFRIQTRANFGFSDQIWDEFGRIHVDGQLSSRIL